MSCVSQQKNKKRQEKHRTIILLMKGGEKWNLIYLVKP